MGDHLSKSDFKVAQTCPTKLYYKKLKYPSLKDENEYLELLAEGGFMVEKIAKLLHPNGHEIFFEEDHEIASRQTLQALAAENATIFEATLISNQKLARVDILVKRGMSFHLIEVKAKSFDSVENAAAVAGGLPNLFWSKRTPTIRSEWEEYLEDVAFQVVVLQELFPHAKISPFLMMPDKSKTTQIDRLYSLFSLERVAKPNSSFSRVVVSYNGDIGELRKDHFLTLVPVHAEVDYLLSSVKAKAKQYGQSLHPELRKIPTAISVICKDCEYRHTGTDKRDGFGECWGTLANESPHVLDLYHIGDAGGRKNPLATELIAQRKASLFNIPSNRLVKADGKVGEQNKRQLIQIEHTRNNSEWISAELANILRRFEYPLHFIDFETSTLAVPYFAGMHPYEQVAFQWSCHTVRSPEAVVEHSEWINIVDAFPNFQFGESLMDCLGTSGTLFMWAPHENTILTKISDQMVTRHYQNQRLHDWLRLIIRTDAHNPGRLVDMNQVTLKHYFHPIMKGRTSVKRVCDAIWKTNPRLRCMYPEYLKEHNGEILSPYDALPPLEIDGKPVVVAEGTGALRAYEAMLYGAERHDEQVREKWKHLLLQYCKLDTLSMVLIWKHWLERTGV